MRAWRGFLQLPRRLPEVGTGFGGSVHRFAGLRNEPTTKATTETSRIRYPGTKNSADAVIALEIPSASAVALRAGSIAVVPWQRRGVEDLVTTPA